MHEIVILFCKIRKTFVPQKLPAIQGVDCVRVTGLIVLCLMIISYLNCTELYITHDYMESMLLL